MNTSCLNIKKTQHVRKNKTRSVDKNESWHHTDENDIRTALNMMAVVSNIPLSPIRSGKKNYRSQFIVGYSILKTRVSQFKLFTRKFAEWTLKNPALSFLDFLADTYYCLNQSEYKYFYKTKFSKYCFLFKYCGLSFMSFYF